MRLVGEDGIVTVNKVNIKKKDEETDHGVAIDKGCMILTVV